MHEVEGPRIERQFLHRLEFEVGLMQELRGRRGEDLDRTGHEIAVAAVGRASTGDIQRHRPHPLVGVGLREAAVFQDRHRPPAHVVVEPLERGRHEPLVVIRRRVAGGQFGEHGLGRGHHEERPLDAPRRLVLEQVGMEATGGRQQLLEDGLEHPPGLADVAKGWLRGRELAQPAGDPFVDPRGCVGPLADRTIGRRWLERGGKVAQRPPHARIEGARGEVQVADDGGGRVPGAPR